MQMIIHMLAIASGVTLALSTNWYQGTLFDRKPFNCALCLGSWIAMVPMMYNHGFLLGLGLAAMTGVVAELLDRKINGE
jgi:hypothetical protein